MLVLFCNWSVDMKVIAVTGYKPFELGIFKNDHPGVECIKKALRRKLTAFCRRWFRVGYNKWPVRCRIMGC